jgi:hypothetical protein
MTVTLPAGFEQAPCPACGLRVVIAPMGETAPLCNTCFSDPRLAAESALAELHGLVRALRLGKGSFAALNQGERDEALATVIGSEYVHVWTYLAVMSDEQIIAYVASNEAPAVHMAAAARELHRRIGKLVVKHVAPAEVAHVEAGPIYTAEPGSEPDPDTRREIEWDAEELARQEMFAVDGDQHNPDFAG